ANRALGGRARTGRRPHPRAPRDRARGRTRAAAIERGGGARADRAHRRDTRQGQAVNKIEIRIMRLPHAADLPLPAYHSAHAAGLDLVAAVPAGAPVIIAPGGRAAIPTGLAFALPAGVEGQITPRSGLP